MDYEAVRAGLEQAIPFNGHLGLEVVDVGEGSGSVRLPDDERLRNHVGSQHAGGLFSAAEAASGAAFVGAFMERMGEITPLAKSAQISYLKLAKGPILATATLGEDKASRSSVSTIRRRVGSASAANTGPTWSLKRPPARTTTRRTRAGSARRLGTRAPGAHATRVRPGRSSAPSR